MKLTEPQTTLFIEEIYPPSPFNKEMESLALQDALRYKKEGNTAYLTISETEVDHNENMARALYSTLPESERPTTFHIPVTCPLCKDHAWYSITLQSITLIGMGGLPAICRKCGGIFLPVHHTGHNKLLKRSCAILLLFLLIIACIIIFAQ